MPKGRLRLAIINAILFIALFLTFSYPIHAQGKITSPKDFLGFNIGDDYYLLNYKKMIDYWKTIDSESERMKLEIIGKTEEGRDQFMAIITSPKNFDKLNEYKAISRKLALAENLSDKEAKELSKKGKAVIWIDGGLHATEVVGANQLAEMAYRMVSMNDDETLRFLDDIILLLVPANPDGQDLVADWYMKEGDPKKRVYNNIPKLYQKYIGHDNNRDFYLNSQKETENMSRVMFLEWFPQIMYNHHQTGPADQVVFVPPFRDPVNYVYDPLLTIGIQAVGVAMHNRLITENKPGAGMRSIASFSIWYNGSLRTTGYFHNQIGILTEMNGSPTPMEIAFNPDRQLATNDLPYPITPQRWHFNQSIEYSITLNKAILDYASRNRENLLYNRYLMGKNSIDRGNKDSWTITPVTVKNAKEKIQKEMTAQRDTARSVQQQRSSQRIPAKYFDFFHSKESRDPRGYIIPSDQPDFPTAVKFVNALIKSGIKVMRAEKEFSAAGKSYPAGSLVIKTNQAFRPHILDMFEPQYHPDDFRYENGPPVPPYDNAGWTLAIQMGVKFDRLLDGFEGPFKPVEGLAKPEAGKVFASDKQNGYLLEYNSNDAVIAVNRLLKENIKVSWLMQDYKSNNKNFPAGTFYIPNDSKTKNIIKELSSSLGLTFTGVEGEKPSELKELGKARVGLWDRYGGSMPSGWTRWILEQFNFTYELVYAKGLNAGNLKDKYDILIFVSGAIPPKQTQTAARPAVPQRSSQSSTPSEYSHMTGNITADTTMTKIKEFIEQGGTVITIGSSTNAAYHYNLPLSSHMVNGKGAPLPREEYYVPASILELKIDNKEPIAFGLPERIPVIFENSPVFRLKPESIKEGIKPLGWFDTDSPLLSGWAWGQDKLYGGTTIASAKIGKGTLYLFGPEILFRAQSHAAFKYLFNGIYLSTIKN